MPTNALRRYLQDHLAGSVAALQLMETLADHERGLPLEQKLRGLHSEVTEEQERLEAILARLEGDESSLKRATAWLTEKLHRGRLALAERADPALARLEGLESLALRLQGKLGLGALARTHLRARRRRAGAHSRRRRRSDGAAAWPEPGPGPQRRHHLRPARRRRLVRLRPRRRGGRPRRRARGRCSRAR